MLFQLIDIDYVFANGKPVIRLFGRTEKGNSVCVLYDKFYPYFYIKSDKTSKLGEIKEIKSYEDCEKMIPLGYREKPEKLVKIFLFNPQEVPVVRERLLAEGIAEEVYEADILFKYRFMVDFGIKGMQWVDTECEKTNTSTIKIPTYIARTIKGLEKPVNSDLKYLCLDIETLQIDPKKQMDPKNSKIIMISLRFSPDYRGKNELVIMAKPFASKNCTGFKDEKEMLENFADIVEKYDPDIITGYNINAFDMPYIIERMKIHKLKTDLGRSSDKSAFIKSYAMSQETILQGRIIVDPYQIIKRDPWVKFHRYDLNTVSLKMLGKGKHDVEYGEMQSLWNGSKDEVERLIEYAKKDAELNMDLLMKKGLMDKFFEVSKISGVLMQDSFGGQTQRIETMILHEFRKRNFVMPSKPQKKDLIKRMNEKKDLKGATVLEPKKGLHSDGCVLVLDFKSLYPSIMRTFNISPDTVVTDAGMNVKKQKSPTGAYFVDKEIRSGTFPDILEKLLEARRKAKKEMKTAEGDMIRVLNARQLALKDISNSFYGYTGYVRARLFMLDVANAITGYGRDNIEKTRKLVEEKYSVEIVYGDTDSIFLKTKITNLDEAKQLGENVSKHITQVLPGLLELEFEKIYRTFLILTKKRYTGWSFKYDDAWKDAIEMRGIETVRRDWCPLVSELLLDVINIILKDGDIQKATTKVKETIEQLKTGKTPLAKLTIIKGITKNPESYDGMLPHIELARKMAARNPQDPPKIGDRIGFVIIKGNQLLSKRAEDPKYIEKNKLEIDSEYYINSQVLPPIERIFSSMEITKSELIGLGSQTSLSDILTGVKRQMKRDIVVDYSEKKKLDGWEEFVCSSCKKSYRHMPLRGNCECGGELSISHNGFIGEKVRLG